MLSPEPFSESVKRFGWDPSRRGVPALDKLCLIMDY